MILNLFILVFASALSVTGCLTFWPIHYIYDAYKAIILFIGGYILGIAVAWLILRFFTLFIDESKEYETPSKLSKFLLYQGLWYINFLANVRYEVRSANKLSSKERYLIVSNHRSCFDPMVMSIAFKKTDMAFICKESIFKIPFRAFLIACCFIPIDRKDKMKSLYAMKRASTLLEKQVTSIALYPEGARQKDDVIGDFHEGCFNIALKTKSPIAIITTKGLDNVAHYRPFRFHKVIFEVVDVLSYEDIKDKPAIEVSNMVKDIMYDNLKPYYGQRTINKESTIS